MKITDGKLNLKEEKGKLKQRFASLVNDDLLFEEGMREVKIGRIQKNLGETKDKLKKIISILK